MNFPILKKAFTLVEIMVATFIGTIILAFIFVYLGDIIDSISKTKAEVRSLGAFYDFSIDLNNYKNIYKTGGVVIDSQSGTGSDVFMFTDLDKSEGVLMGLVDLDSYKLSTTTKIYKDFSIGFRDLTAQDIDNISNTGSIVYDFLFQKDDIYKNLKVQDLQLSSYNSGSIFDLDMVLNLNYYNGLKGSNWSDISREDLLRINLNF